MNFINNKSLFAIAAMAAALISCSDEDAQKPIDSVDAEFGKFTKELIVFDAEKNNSAVLLVGSDDESVLNMWTADNFTLIPIKEGQTLADVFDSKVSEESLDEDVDVEDGDEDENVAASISTKFVSRNLQDGVKNVALQITDPYDSEMRGWKYSTYYSDCYGDYSGHNSGKVTCNVYGHNVIHRGYYGISFMKYTYSNWSTLVGEWTRIQNNETVSKSVNCFQMKARRKYKGTNPSVTIEFEY